VHSKLIEQQAEEGGEGEPVAQRDEEEEQEAAAAVSPRVIYINTDDNILI
jgi:hypothetical protein